MTPDPRLDSELRFHFEKRVAEFMAQGASRAEAVARARARMGDVRGLAEYSTQLEATRARRHRRRRWLPDLWQDVRHGFRQASRFPAATLVAVLTLAFGIGGTTATYAAVRKLLLTPIPGVDTSRLIKISKTNQTGSLSVTPSIELVDAWTTGVPSLEAVGYFASRETTIDLGTGREGTTVGLMSPNLLSVIGIRPALGRMIQPGETDVVLLGHGVWQSRFGGESSVLGRTVAIDGRPHVVIGILPRAFTIPFATAGARRDLWIPTTGEFFPWVIARVRPDVGDAQVLGELDAAMASVSDGKPAGGWRATLAHPFDDVNDSTKDSLLVLFGAMAIVMLAGCANVANLLLARAQVRRHEFVIRQSLGASRGRVVRQLLAESSLLAVGGWMLGLAVAWSGLRLVEGLRPEALSMLDGLSLDPPLVWGSLGVAAITSVLFGLAPALFAAGRPLAGQGRLGNRSTTGDRSARQWRSAFVMGEVALSVMLLVGAGLLLRTLVEMQRQPLGFEPAGLYRARVLLPETRYPTNSERSTVFARVLEGVQALPGVSMATWSAGVPPEVGISIGTLEIEGREAQPEGQTILGSNQVLPEYFGLTSTRLVEGRLFGRQASDHEIIVSEALARTQWPDASAVGKRLRLSSDGPWSQVVGVASDVTIPRPGATGGSSPISQMIYNLFDAPWHEAVLVVRHDPGVDGLPGLFPSLAGIAAGIDPEIEIRDVAPALDAVMRTQALPRFIATLLVAFAIMAVLLSAVGLYGVIAYTVTRRWREIGIRIALGANSADVLRPVLVEGAWMVGAGLLAGLGGAWWATRGLSALLYRVGPSDAGTFAAAGGLLATVALAAVIVPSLRATRVDPAIVLRE